MSRWRPCKRPDFIRRLRRLGFHGLFSGARHQFMVYAEHRLTIPSNSEFSVGQLQMILREVEEVIGRRVTLEEWEEL
jgi:predicted RNA binding protein YcfA (HicA-like mRNA interferase family)